MSAWDVIAAMDWAAVAGGVLIGMLIAGTLGFAMGLVLGGLKKPPRVQKDKWV